jgi:malonyl-CoA O-methyltransferase
VNRVDRQRVKGAFGRQAAEYEGAAMVQKRVLERFQKLLEGEAMVPRSLLDIGCGTGLLLERLGRLWPGARRSGCDLAWQMCAAAAGRPGNEGVTVACADCERLPFADASFDLVVSTSTFQWLETPEQAFREARRVLAPGGVFAFALFGQGTLRELQESWRAALAATASPSPDRSHRFPGAAEVEAALSRAGFADCTVVSEVEQERYADVRGLLRNLRRVGAGNASPETGQGLGERRLLQAMMECYERCYGDGEGIPASYGVIYCLAR